jgi:glutamine synthetase type III
MTSAPPDRVTNMTHRPRDIGLASRASGTDDAFGALTFTGDVMLKRLSEDVFRKLQQTMRQGLPLDPAIANTVARTSVTGSSR